MDSLAQVGSAVKDLVSAIRRELMFLANLRVQKLSEAMSVLLQAMSDSWDYLRREPDRLQLLLVQVDLVNLLLLGLSQVSGIQIRVISWRTRYSFLHSTQLAGKHDR